MADTMKVKLLATMATFKRAWPAGAIVDLPTSDATRMIERGLAQPVRDPSPEIEPPSRGEQTVRRPPKERRART
jgi:hypothetical protein